MKPGESHSYYTDEEETPSNKLHLENPKQSETFIKNSADKNELPKTELNDEEIVSSTSDNDNEESDATKTSNDPTIHNDEPHTWKIVQTI